MGLSDAVRLYGNANYSHSLNIAAENFIPPNDKGNVREIYPDGFQPFGHFEKEDIGTTLGTRITTADDATIDINAYYGQNTQWLSVSPSVNATLGNDSPTAFDVSTKVNKLSNIAVDYKKDVDLAALASPLSFSSGVPIAKNTFTPKRVNTALGPR